MTMTKMKFATLLVALVSVFTLSSCFNSDDDPTRQNVAIAKVQSTMGMFYSFKTSDGITITPTASSIAAAEAKGSKVSESVGKVVYMVYSWDSSVLTIPEGSKDIKDVTFNGFIPLDNKVEIVTQKGASNDSVATAPIISLEYTGGGSQMKPVFFDENIIILPTNYHMNSKIHYLTAVYYPDEDNAGKLRIHLRHNANKDTSGQLTSVSFIYSRPDFYYRVFDLTEVIREYMRKTGQPRPNSIEVECLENSYSLDIEAGQTETKIYTITKEEKPKE